MKLIFFDEAKSDPDYPHYHLGGVCIDEEHLASVEKQVNIVAGTAFDTYELSRDTELHAADLYHRKRHFKGMLDFGERVGLLIEMAKILSAEEVRLIDVQINCNLLGTNKTAEDVAFMFLCERANDLVKAHKSLGMLIGDRESDHLADRFSTTLSGYRALRTKFAFGRDVKNLVDSVHFTHSHLSRFLQLADVYTWLLQFTKRNQHSENQRHQTLITRLKQPPIDLSPSKYKHWPLQKL